MKLLTHNLLMCNKKGCTINNYPLRIQATNIITKPHELDIDTLERMVKKVDWNGLVIGCKDINYPIQFNFETLTEEQKKSKEFYQEMNKMLYEVIIQDGMLKCENCGREYPIVNGIANLSLKDEEL